MTAAAAVTCLPLSDPIAPAPTPPGLLGGVFAGVRLNALQVTSASTVVSVAKSLHVTRRGIRIALAVAMQESSLDPAAARGAFIGLFQQRSDLGSGLYTQYNRLDPAGAATMFFQQLIKRVPKYDTDARLDWQIGEVIQQTGVGRNVEQWFGLAQALTTKLVAWPLIILIPPVSRSLQPVPLAVLGSPGYRALTPSGLRQPGRAFTAALPTTTTTPTTPATTIVTTTTTTPATTTPATTTPATANSPTTSPAGSTITTPATTSPATTSPTTSLSTRAVTLLTVARGASTVPGSSTTPTTGPPAATTSTTTTKPTNTTTTPTTTKPTTTTTTTKTTGSPTVLTPKPTVVTPKPTVPTSNVPKPTVPKPVVPKPVVAKPVVPKPVVPKPVVPKPAKPVVAKPVVPKPTVSATPSANDPFVGPDPTGPAMSSAAALTDCSPSAGGRSTSFDPGLIISDAIFYNSKSMTAADIRSFINTKGYKCVVAACLRFLKVSTPNKPADKYCAAYKGGTREDVATILLRLSVACRINPQVMLVTLQKESALLTKTKVTLASYQAMYGWHCPDSGPAGSPACNPLYAGFFNQAYGMAKQWARYRINPQNYNYRAGQTPKILWNVAQSGCGGSSVYIRNTATASLYNYTPYQPNAASLAAYPGVGDRCSSYGNRNFFFLFQQYFGTTGGGVDQNVVLNGRRVTIPSGPHVAAGAAGKVIIAPTLAMAKGLAAGLAAIGIPYVYGGGTNDGGADQGCARAGGALNSCKGIVGFDCSGLTGYVLQQSGVHIPTYSAAQRAGGKSVSWANGVPGDIIGYKGHVAVYLGMIGGTRYLLEAPDVGKFVQVRSVYYSNGGIPVDAVLHRYWR